MPHAHAPRPFPPTPNLSDPASAPHSPNTHFSGATLENFLFTAPPAPPSTAPLTAPPVAPPRPVAAPTSSGAGPVFELTLPALIAAATLTRTAAVAGWPGTECESTNTGPTTAPPAEVAWLAQSSPAGGKGPTSELAPAPLSIPTHGGVPAPASSRAPAPVTPTCAVGLGDTDEALAGWSWGGGGGDDGCDLAVIFADLLGRDLDLLCVCARGGAREGRRGRVREGRGGRVEEGRRGGGGGWRGRTRTRTRTLTLAFVVLAGDLLSVGVP